MKDPKKFIEEYYKNIGRSFCQDDANFLYQKFEECQEDAFNSGVEFVKNKLKNFLENE